MRMEATPNEASRKPVPGPGYGDVAKVIAHTSHSVRAAMPTREIHNPTRPRTRLPAAPERARPSIPTSNSK